MKNLNGSKRSNRRRVAALSLCAVSFTFVIAAELRGGEAKTGWQAEWEKVVQGGEARRSGYSLCAQPTSTMR
jgi:hypothetical protein